MALSPHPRKFTLHVSDIDVDLGDQFTETGGEDEVVVVFHGKVLPSVQNRIFQAIEQDGNLLLEEHKLVK
jgi:hypothetical protein